MPYFHDGPYSGIPSDRAHRRPSRHVAQSNPERELWLLRHEIEPLEVEFSRQVEERRAVHKQAASATRRYRYLTFLRWLRASAAKYELWSMGVMLTVALVSGAIGFVSVHFLTSSVPQAFVGFISGFAIGIGVFALLVHYPSNEVLLSAIAAAEVESKLLRSRLRASLCSKIGKRCEGTYGRIILSKSAGHLEQRSNELESGETKG